jgi:uncharacterized protein
MRKIFINLIIFYQKIISSNSYISCRYSPSCSNYSIQAINKFGVIIGLFLSTKRLSRCVFFSRMSYDPVPSNKKITLQVFISMFHVKHTNKNRLGKE